MNELTLSQLASLIRETINISFDSYYWVKAEIHQINVNYSGHCYLQLVEKDEVTDTVKANIRAVIWANKYRILSEYFRDVTQTDLKAGIKLLVKVEVNFHHVYGLSLIINDIDPRFTLGDIAQRRDQIIAQLKADGVFDLNKSLDFPVVPQRIAIISSATAAGLSDFLNHLSNNEYGYAFHTQLFEAVMQGENTEKTVTNALNKIYETIDNFDVVVIIRGGGSKLDLSAFDSYKIASHIAQFPIPVLTGIGHQRDLSIADMVAFESLKTPTATADFIIRRTADFELQISEIYDKIVSSIKNKIANERDFLEASQNLIISGVRTFMVKTKEELFLIDKKMERIVFQYINTKKNELSELQNRIMLATKILIKSHSSFLNDYMPHFKKIAKNYIDTQKKLLISYEKILEANNPQHILNMGYSITTIDGKVVTSPEELQNGDKIDTRLKNGRIKSIVKK